MHRRFLGVVGLTVACLALAGGGAVASADVLPAIAVPPPDCGAFLTGLTATPAHDSCTVAYGDAALSCRHDSDSSSFGSYNDFDCLARVSSLLGADCFHADGDTSGAPYDATTCTLAVDALLVVDCSGNGGSAGPGQETRRDTTCSIGPLRCGITMSPDPRYGVPATVTPACPEAARRAARPAR